MEHKFGAKPIVIGVIFVILVSAIFVIFSSILGMKTKIVIGDSSFQARIVSDENDRNKILLGGLDTGGENILFAFPSDGVYSVSMKNVSKPIDILWLDKTKKIVHIVKNTDTEVGTVTTYKSKSDARFIVELPSGSVDSNNITINQVANFKINMEDVK